MPERSFRFGRIANYKARYAESAPMMNSRKLQNLRLRYNAAMAAYRTCADALSEASMRREAPSAALLEAEAKASKDLNDAREALLSALLEHARSSDPPS